MSAATAGHIERAYQKSRAWNTDIFGIGRQFDKYMPEKWNDMAENWDHIITETELQVKVTSHIRQFGLLEEPPFFDIHTED